MAISISSSSPSQVSAQLPDTATADVSKAGDAKPSSTATASKAQATLNAAIVQSSIDVSISSGNDSLTLMLKSAITGINEALAPDFGPNAIQNAASQDNSPEGTAGRIVALSTGFYGAYKSQHPGVSDADNLKNFMTTIQGGFEKGFGEAKDILQGLKALQGDVASNIEKTHALVLQGYADFVAAQSAPPADSPSVSA
jgi:hypothetical protein